ncbi:MAG: sigma-70 family RNA polymerase sigma factor, partial [Anaerolineae bacterium]
MKRFEFKARSEAVQKLLDQSEEHGYLTLDEILEVFPEAEKDLNALDNLFACLYDRGLAIYTDGGSVDLESSRETGDVTREDGQPSGLDRIPMEDAVGLYLAEMSQEPLLTAEEEVELARQFERGRQASRKLSGNGHGSEEKERLERLVQKGQQARDHLVKANTRLVVSIAKRYRGLGLPFLDLIQAGNVGLLRAVDRYDYHLGYKLGTYATWWIRQAVTRALSQHGRTIRLPIHLGDRIRRVYRVMQRMEQDTGLWPTPEEVAEEVKGMTPKEVRRLVLVSQRPRSLHEPVGDEQDVGEFGDFVEDKDTPSPVQSAVLQILG